EWPRQFRCPPPPWSSCNRAARTSRATQATKLQDADSLSLFTILCQLGLGRLWRDEVSGRHNIDEKVKDYGLDKNLTEKRGDIRGLPHSLWSTADALADPQPAESALRICKERNCPEPSRFLTPLPPGSATNRPIRFSRCYPDRSRRSGSFSNLRVG